MFSGCSEVFWAVLGMLWGCFKDVLDVCSGDDLGFLKKGARWRARKPAPDRASLPKILAPHEERSDEQEVVGLASVAVLLNRSQADGSSLRGPKGWLEGCLGSPDGVMLSYHRLASKRVQK